MNGNQVRLQLKHFFDPIFYVFAKNMKTKRQLVYINKNKINKKKLNKNVKYDF